MPSFATRNTARVVGAVRIAAAVLLLGLAACDGAKPPADPATATGAPGATNTVGQSAGPAEGQQAAVQPSSEPQGPAQPLDTGAWVLPPPFYAAGDEPFWRLEISDGWFAFRRSGLKAIEEPLVQPARVSGADVFTTGALKVSIKRETCEMDQGSHSDFTATVTFDGIDFDGCAFGGQVAASQEAGTVTDALASIDACLAKLGQPAVVTAVYPRQDGEQKAVALRARTGQLYECATDATGADVAYLDPIERGAEESWMSRMRFLRSTVPTTVNCPTAEEVRADDKVVGKLLAKACKF